MDSARDALASLEDGQTYHLIITDVMLPEMSSKRFHERLQESYPAYAERVVFLSGGAFADEARAFLESVPNDVLDKPISPDGLRALAQRFARVFK